jgi:hypothetical protein
MPHLLACVVGNRGCYQGSSVLTLARRHRSHISSCASEIAETVSASSMVQDVCNPHAISKPLRASAAQESQLQPYRRGGAAPSRIPSLALISPGQKAHSPKSHPYGRLSETKLGGCQPAQSMPLGLGQCCGPCIFGPDPGCLVFSPPWTGIKQEAAPHCKEEPM